MVSEKLRVGILGATGIVGQNYIRLLQDHPWFEVIDLAASPRSAGLKFDVAVKDKWQMDFPIPNNVVDLPVRDVSDFKKLPSGLDFVFSAISMPNKDDIKNIEFEYARHGIPVVSNNSAHRWTPDVPMIIPEINHDHIKIIPIQKKNHGFSKGFVVVKPNCSIQSYLTPIFALEKAGYKVNNVIITTLQAVSGAGYPGVASLDILDNVVPYISGEEEKSEKEPLKVLGTVGKEEIILNKSIEFSANCARVPVTDGHLACVNLKFKEKIPSKEDIITIWKNFKSLPQEAKLPYAPIHPIIYDERESRPQPRKDRNNDKAMAITVGRLRKDNVFDYKFVGLSHNTIRGAAGGAILIAELIKEMEYFN
jgi:aspartate-semialdehyde dehydrogenase